MLSFFKADQPFRPNRFPFFYGWWILFVASIGIVASIPGQTMGFSVFTPILTEHLALTSSSISTAYLIGTICSGLLLPRIGNWFDRWGARIIATLVSICMGIGLLYLSQVDRIAHYLFLLFPKIPASYYAFTAIMLGFFWLRFTGQGVLTMTSRSMLGKWFNHKRGIAIAISGIITSFSFSIAPKVLDLGIETLGWREVWMTVGILMITAMALFIWLFYRDNPEECGLQMDGEPESSHSVTSKPGLKIYHEFTRKEALRTRAFWIFNLSLGLNSYAGTGYTFHVVSIAEDLGVGKAVILHAFVPASIFGILVSFLVGAVSNRIQLKHLLLLLPAGGLCFSLGPLIRPEATGWFVIFGLGLSGGVFGFLTGMVWPRFFGRKHLGAISGVNMSTLVYSSAIAPLCFSLVYESTGHYRVMFMIITILSIISIIASFWAGNPQRRYQSQQPS